MASELDLASKKDLSELLKNNPIITTIASRLQERFQPLHIYLFGSRVLGNHREDSDYDFVVVVNNTDKSRIENMQIAREVLFDLDVAVDVFVYDKKYFEEWKNELNSIPEVAYHFGVEIPRG